MGKLDRWRVTVVKPGRNDGANWQLRYAPPRGSAKKVRRTSSGTKDREIAEEKARSEQARLNKEARPGLQVLAVYDAYVDHLRVEGVISRRSMERYERERAFFDRVLGNAVASDMSGALVDKVIGSMLAEGYRASTAKCRLQLLRAAWGWALRQGLVSHAWVLPQKIRGKARAGLRTNKRPYTPRELERLLLGLPEIYRAPGRLLAETGCRLEEAVGLDVDDLRIDDLGRVWADLRDTKSGRPRSLPVMPETAKLLDRAAENRTDGPLFLSPRRLGNRLSGGAIRRQVVKVLTETGMRRRVAQTKIKTWDLDVHSRRRAWIAHAARAGVPDSIRRIITGHEFDGVAMGYQRNYIGDDLHSWVGKVLDWRRSQVEPTPADRGQPHNSNGYMDRRSVSYRQPQAERPAATNLLETHISGSSRGFGLLVCLLGGPD